MKTHFRTHTCSELTLKNVNEKVTIAGWVQTVRDLGGVVFIDVRDQYGITQVVTSDSNLTDSVSRIPNESTVSFTGTVRKRSEDTINTNISTGEIEIVIENFEILGKRFNNLPFEINSNLLDFTIILTDYA